MIVRQKGNWWRRFVHAIVAIALRLFFRRIEVGNAENVPSDEPLIFVLNHPNGLIDPALVFVALPRRVSFLAKSTLFKIPVMRFLLKTVEALPLYRRVDDAANVNLNQRTFAACFELLGQNRCIALFPEGVSNDSTKLLPLKTGAARIALGALAVGGEQLKLLKIVPCGLYYTAKTAFRSQALIRFGEPFTVSKIALDADGQPPPDAVLELSERIAANLRLVTLNVENKNALAIVERTEKLFSSVYESIAFQTPLADEFALRQNFAARFEQLKRENPARAAKLEKRLARFADDLRVLNLSPENLSLTRHSTMFVLRYFVLRIALILALSPLVLIGAVLHLPAYLLCLLLGRAFRFHGVDDGGGTIKIVAAIALMPLTWLVLAVVLWLEIDWRAALASIPAAVICGYAALRCLEELIDLRGWFVAVWILFRRRRAFIRLLRERLILHHEIAALG